MDVIEWVEEIANEVYETGKTGRVLKVLEEIESLSSLERWVLFNELFDKYGYELKRLAKDDVENRGA